MTDHIDMAYIKTETELSDLSDRVQSVMKTRQDDDLIDVRFTLKMIPKFVINRTWCVLH